MGNTYPGTREGQFTIHRNSRGVTIECNDCDKWVAAPYGRILNTRHRHMCGPEGSPWDSDKVAS